MNSLQHTAKGFQSLVQILRSHSNDRPSAIAFTFLADGENESARVTFGGLDQAARSIGAELQKRNLSGEQALLLYPPGIEFIAAFLGCLYAGVVAVPLYPPRANRSDGRVEAIAQNSKAKIALTVGSLLPRVQQTFSNNPAFKNTTLLATDEIQGSAESWQQIGVAPDDVAYLQYTSGSTTTPRGVMVSHRNLVENVRMCAYGCEADESSVFVTWLPHFHDMGLVGTMLVGVLVGFQIVLMPPVAFLQRPIRWLRAATKYKATNLGAPNFAFDLCARRTSETERAGLKLNSIKVAYCGAEPIRAETISEFLAGFEPYGFRSEAFRPTYGLAEATVLVTVCTKESPLTILTLDADLLAYGHAADTKLSNGRIYKAISCGSTSYLNTAIRISDPERKVRLPDGRIGEIWVKGRHIAKGYFGNAEETKRTFDGRFLETNDGPYLRTGDLGFVRDGVLFVTGRLKDLIIIRGRNFYPQDIESTAERCHQAIRIGGCAAFSIERQSGEDIILAVELERDSRKIDTSPLAAALRERIAAEHELHLSTIVFVQPTGIPKTSSGKVQRRLCSQMFLEGTLSEIARQSFQGCTA